MAAHDDGPTFDEVYRRHFQPLVVQLYAFVADMSEAQDLVQEAFSRAWPRWHRISRYDDPVAWVRRVAWNIAISRWHRLRTARLFSLRQRVEVVNGPGPDRVVLAAALATLPVNHRRAVVLHYLAGLTVGEIAEDCGVAPARSSPGYTEPGQHWPTAWQSTNPSAPVANPRRSTTRPRGGRTRWNSATSERIGCRPPSTS